MKRTCLLLLAWLAAITAAMANVVIFDPTVDVGTGSTTASPYCIEKAGVTVSISKGMANGIHYRVYKNETITICSSICDIVKIEFQCVAMDDAQYGPGNFVTDVGSYSYQGYIGVWEGVAPCVTFTAVGNQVRLTKIVVTYECNGVRSPVIRPASGTYYNPIEVTMTCPNSGASIYYTTNGSDPTPASTPYVAPFTLSAGTTVKAVAVLDGEMSDVATATYEFLEATQVNCLWDALLAPDGEVIFIPNPVTVLAQNKNYLFVKDYSAYALIYGQVGQSYVQGDIIPGGFYVTKTFFNGEPELSYPQGFQPAIGNTPVEPEEISGGIGHDLFAHYVVLRNVSIVKNGTQYIIIDEDGNEYPAYFGSMGFPAPYDLTVKYDVYAIVGSYGRENTVYQLLPIGLHRITEYTLCDLPSTPDGETVIFDHEAQVVYQHNYYLYLKDECGFGLVYGNVGQTYEMGDIIPPGWGGVKTTYNGEPEISHPTGFQPAIRNEEIIPMPIDLSRVGHDLWAHYVEVHNVIIDQEHMVVIDEHGNSCPYYPQLPYQVDPTMRYDIRAIITSYGRENTIYQLYIIWTSYIVPPPPGACCLNDLYLNSSQGEVTEFVCPLTVIYQNGAYLYVKDSCGDYGLIYGSCGGPFKNGDQIIGYASWTTYQGTFQLSPYHDWTKVGETDPVEPEEMPIEEISHDMVHWYVRLSDVAIKFGDVSPWAEDETGVMAIFDRFQPDVVNGVAWIDCDVNCDNEINIADINALIDAILRGYTDDSPMLRVSPDDLVPDATYDVDGFIYVYKNELEIIPVRIVRHGIVIPPPCPPPFRYDVNGDGEVTIADVNCIIEWIFNH